MANLSNGMTIDEQLGQLLMVGFPGTTVTAELQDLIERQHVGGIILFTRNIQDALQVRALTTQLQRIARAAGHRYPLLISVDQENGMVRRLGKHGTEFPGNMALGAVDDEALTYEVALATGRELKALGINMNLAPDVDVNNNPANPVIGVRSFGEDPQLVARHSVAAVKGYQAAGVISNLKHFPGHGDTAVDSHLALPTIPYNLERLEQIELIPFKRAIEAGGDSVMIAHIYLPALMQDALLPATISPEIVKDLLRTRLGYQGVITSDCMEMNAISETIGTEQGVVRAVQAGIDLVLVSHRYDRQMGSLAALRAALQEGSVSLELVQTAVARTLALKERLLSWEEAIGEEDEPEQLPAVVRSPAHLALGLQAYERSTTLVRDTEHLLPLHLAESERLLLVFPFPGELSQAADRGTRADEIFVEEMKKRHAQIEILKVGQELTPEIDQRLEQAAHAASRILVVTMNANLHPDQVQIVQRLLQMQRPVIGIAVYNPYDLQEFPGLGTYLVTYEYTPPALSAAVRVLFGETPAQGKLPVSLPGLQEMA